ncbi:MAG: ABC transporter ATP-binding protein [Anaerolineae bacterium]|nr:ABC transporter ATP-binding protein [Anaerolineae bacterium]
MLTHAIETQHLRKLFDEKVAVADLTLTVERGEVFGFLGPNGAGKTTSIKMLLGLITPTSGAGRLFDIPLGDPRGRVKVGFLPEHFRFHDWLKATEFLQLHADLYHIPREVSHQRIPELLELVNLSAHADKKLRAFSKGMLQRIGLAQALLNEPDLVFLDEPTSGLDPMGRRLVRDIIRDLRERGTTVFLNSHLLSEVEITCDRVAFIKQGQIVHTSRLDALLEGEVSVTIRAGLPATNSTWETILDGLHRWSANVHTDNVLSSKNVQITLSLPGEADLPAITRYLVDNNVDVYAVTPQHISLEELFIKIVGTEIVE